MNRPAAVGFLGLVVGFLFPACSTSKVVVNEKEFVAHAAVDFENLRFRRPATPVFDVEATASRVRYDGAGNFDCERPEAFFAKRNLAAIRACIAELAKPIELEWNLKKDGQPTLELRDPEEAPECVRATLGEIPFPREIVYVVPSETSGRGECYTSRLTLDPGVLLGWELPRSRIRLRVGFPLRVTPKTDRDVERTLRAWTLSIYRGGSREDGAFHGRFLPTRYCVRCLDLPEDMERGAATIPISTSLWPSRAGSESVRWGSDLPQ